MIKFTTTILRFAENADKTGWTYIIVPEELAQQLKPGNRREFKVKGKLDAHPIQRVSLFPVKGGDFMMALNAPMRKAIAKNIGAMLKVQLQEDTSEFVFNADFMTCLADEPAANDFFQTLPGSHQRYFSKWIDEAKTDETRIRRITLSVNALAQKMGYGEMIRANKKK